MGLVSILTIPTALAASVVFYHLVCISFGAPLFELMLETLVLDVLLTCLTTVPCLFLLGLNFQKWLEVILLQRFNGKNDVIACYGVMGALVGAWAGAIPIPLDWNASWQEWPISCCITAVIGCGMGVVLALSYSRRKLH